MSVKKSEGFTAEERAAMRERAKEQKAEAQKADGVRAMLAKIAEMPETDRAMAERLHEIVKASAPELSQKTWYGMPAYANKEGKIVCFFQSAESATRGTLRSVSATRRTSTRAPCGRPRLR